MPQVTTPQLQSILDISTVVFAVAVLIFIGVEAALLYAIFRFRDRGDGRSAARFASNQRLEIAWTVAPLAVLLVVFALMLGAMQRITAAPADALVVRVIGHQWWWEFRYGDVVTANELHLPLGKPALLEITSADVIHSFWVPSLAGKRDGVPTQIQHLTITPMQEGSFGGACAEFCGQEHAWMLISVLVESPDRFQAWLDGQRAPATATTNDAGAQLFLSSTCINCHTIRGTTAAGTAGPDLTHFASRANLGAGVAPNDDAHRAVWIRDAGALKPGVLMPPFALSDTQITGLVRFLGSLK
ncbi:MAG: cytochrome c oxidase subunit II [Chloroflexi bacterium 13_1_40CM_4_68_4]|nr:MAG: cytochrome c oxidase subunit II [Chloroflexi bacterium 13_1_40CM_4_68_4]